MEEKLLKAKFWGENSFYKFSGCKNYWHKKSHISLKQIRDQI